MRANKNYIIFASRFLKDPWCNGSTTDFGSVCPGSNPGGSTEIDGGSHLRSRFFYFHFLGALWRAPFKSFSPRSVFGKARLRGLLVVARSLLAVAKNPAGLQKDITAPAGARHIIIF